MEYIIDCSSRVPQIEAMNEVELFDHFMGYMEAKIVRPTATIILEVETMFPEILIPLPERLERMSALAKKEESPFVLGYIIVLKTGEVLDTMWSSSPLENTSRWKNYKEKVEIENLEDVAEVLFWRNTTMGWSPRAEAEYQKFLKKL